MMSGCRKIENIIHNTRLFPKSKGAAHYRLTGIAKRCDWSIMTDQMSSDVSLRGDFLKQPRTVFLSLRSIFNAIPYFYEEVLPKINDKFVLITGSEDITIPNQLDVRWRPFNSREKEIISNIIADERLIHWFAENRDEARPKMSTLPVGYVFLDESRSAYITEFPETLVRDRALKVLCAHRIRKGPQWAVRRNLTNLCNESFQDFATVLTEEVSDLEFQKQVRQHPFVLCAQGGGLDPSPKAWFSLANGSIPIIKSSTLDDAYSQLPVVFVDDWNEDCLSVEKLHEWVEEYSRYFDDKRLRVLTLQRLSLDYWWKRITQKLI